MERLPFSKRSVESDKLWNKQESIHSSDISSVIFNFIWAYKLEDR